MPIQEIISSAVKVVLGVTVIVFSLLGVTKYCDDGLPITSYSIICVSGLGN